MKLTILKEERLKLYRLVMKLRKKLKIGQRKISKIINERYGMKISESTVSNWIYHGRIPGRNETTWFKPKSKPKKAILQNLYLQQEKSLSEIGKRFGVTAITVKNWLKSYGISVRTHKEAMNTKRIKEILGEKMVKRPTKNFSKLTCDKAYLLGVLCGDGCLTEYYRLRLEVKDEKFIRKFVECVNNVYGLNLKYIFYKPRKTFVFQLHSKIITKDLLKYGSHGRYSWEVPMEIAKDLPANML